MTTPENIESLYSNEVFVFGSNLAGYHGCGAAKDALKFGAKWGYGRGPAGQTYALPTKKTTSESLSLADVEFYVLEFLEHARSKKGSEFLVTKVGCGKAGFTPEQIAPFFKGASENVVLPQEFNKILKEQTNLDELV